MTRRRLAILAALAVVAWWLGRRPAANSRIPSREQIRAMSDVEFAAFAERIGMTGRVRAALRRPLRTGPHYGGFRTADPTFAKPWGDA